MNGAIFIILVTFLRMFNDDNMCLYSESLSSFIAFAVCLDSYVHFGAHLYFNGLCASLF